MDDHSHHHHHGDHMDSPNPILNTTILSNISAVVAQGVKTVTDTLSNSLTGDSAMDHSGHMDHSEHSMDSHQMGGVMGGMRMYFHFGYSETILFHGWAIDTVGGLIGSMIGIFILALFYEALKYFREYLFKRSIKSMGYTAASPGKNTSTASNGSPLSNSSSPCAERERPVQYMDQVLLPTPLNMMSFGHLLQTFLHILQLIISYCLMLIFMTYNVWLGLAVTLGAGLGYFIFGWKKSVIVDVTEHCH